MENKNLPVKDIDELVVELAGSAAARWLLMTITTVGLLTFSMWALLTSRDFIAVTAVIPAFLTLMMSLRAASVMNAVNRTAQKLLLLVMSTQAEVAKEILKIAPDKATRLVFMKVSDGAVDVYRPIQWWSDTRMLIGTGEEVWNQLPAYREMLSEWAISEEEDRITISLHLMKKKLRSGLRLENGNSSDSKSSQWLVDAVNKLATIDPREEDIELALPN